MTDSRPLVRICIPTYNAGKSLRETLASIVGQSYTNLEILIVDNASADDTVAIAESFADPRISIHRNAENIGAERNFTRCIELAGGAYTAIYHADDIYQPDMVERQVAFLERNPDAGAVFVNAALIDADGKLFGSYGLPEAARSEGDLYDRDTILRLVLRHSNFLICPSAMVRSQVYREDIRDWRGYAFNTSADLDVWLRILEHHRIGILPDKLIHYRISLSQGSALLRARVDRADFFLVLDHYLERPDIRATLSASDWRNVARLERTDRIVRAVNLYLKDRPEEARVLCRGVLSIDSLRAALEGFRGMATLAAGLLVQTFCLLRWPTAGKFVLLRMKRLANK